MVTWCLLGILALPSAGAPAFGGALPAPLRCPPPETVLAKAYEGRDGTVHVRFLAPWPTAS